VINKYLYVYRYDVSLYLELQRLQDFQIDDLKRYYEAIDRNIDSDEELRGNRKIRFDDFLFKN
jgi:hypothetical protein